jgi:hypothetical protein
MSNFSIGSSAFSVTSPAFDVAMSTPSTKKPAGPLYPQSSSVTVAGSLSSTLLNIGQLADSRVVPIQTRGDEVMQEVQPKGIPGSGSGYSPNTVSGACEDGALANAGAAAGQILGERVVTGGDKVGGALGKELGGVICTVGDILNPFDMGPENVYDPSQPGDGGECSDPGPTGGVSAGTTGGYCADPATGNSSSAPAGDEGTYIGEVDDPDFVNGDKSSPSGTSGSNTDNSTKTDDSAKESAQGTDGAQGTPEETTQCAPDDGPKPTDARPADDGTGSTGPAGPRANVYSGFAWLASGAESRYMPADDSVGGGTPRSNIAHAALGGLATFNAVLLSGARLR